jgi:hypothetical protein
MANSTKALLMGRIQMCKTNPSIAHIGLATHGRSIQIGSSPSQPTSGRDRRQSRGNGGLDSKSSSLAARTPLARPEKPAVNDNSNAKARVITVVHLNIAVSAQLRDVMLGELNEIGSEDEAAKWAQRRMQEKNKLNATDAKHVEIYARYPNVAPSPSERFVKYFT